MGLGPNEFCSICGNGVLHGYRVICNACTDEAEAYRHTVIEQVGKGKTLQEAHRIAHAVSNHKYGERRIA
jgi:hypothetical protein